MADVSKRDILRSGVDVGLETKLWLWTEIRGYEVGTGLGNFGRVSDVAALTVVR